jgi:trimeric autotransporter adhesin
MKRVPVALLAVLGIFVTAVQSARPQMPEAAQASAVAQAVSASSVQASVPRLVQFAGTLKDAWARPVSGVASVTFAIYAEQDGGTALWSETQNVIAESNGHYSAVLGAATANGVPAELFGAGQSRWLGVTIARQQEMPRILLASVPYALKAADAETLGGLPASAYVTTQSLAVLAGKTSLVPSGNTANAVPRTGTPAVMPEVTPTGGGTTDFIPLWTSSSVLGNSILFQNAGKVGIGTTTPMQTLDVAGNSIFRGSFQLMPGGTATASGGDSSHSMQWNASVFNSGTKSAQTFGFGFRALPVNNNSPAPAAQLDLLYGPGGGVLTDMGFSIDSFGVVSITGTPSTNQTVANAMLLATAPDASLDSGFLGLNGLVGTGGSGDQDSLARGGTGVLGFGGGGGTAGGGPGSGTGQDGAGGSFSGGSQAGELGDGIDAVGGSGFAAVFTGDINVTGEVDATVKLFKIDHPQDPANKYLVHASVESSETINLYTGNVLLDAGGAAVVQLPAWFQAENADFRYSLAAVGTPAPNLYVAEEIAGNQFKIAGGRAGQKVSWQVTGVRQDPYAKVHPLVVEQAKKPREQGYYVRPELFGQPEEKGMEWARHPEMMKQVKTRREKQMALAKKSGTAQDQPTPRQIGSDAKPE